MHRDHMMDRLERQGGPWDLVIAGGGATGVGIALDAATRGYRVLLLEQSDFGQGTSSRSTKLVHGGVRYLQQGNLSLVMEALRERERLRRNAPHLVSDLPFIVPLYRAWEAPYYGLGLKLYDLLAHRDSFGRSRWLSREATLAALPTLRREGLRGGILYHDGLFDDARLLIHLAQTAATHGAVLINYCRIESLLRHADGTTAGVVARDLERDAAVRVTCRCLINATGPFADAIRHLDRPDSAALIAPSQGVHIVLDREFLPGETAMMVPRTPDGRIMFAIPWHEHVIVGTTDTPLDHPSLEPQPRQDEVALILATASQYLARPPSPADVRSMFAGIRPLVRAGKDGPTSALARDHLIEVSSSGVITVAGGKWTTYRKMAEDCVDRAALLAGLAQRPSVTRNLRLHGYQVEPVSSPELQVYGADASQLLQEMSDDSQLQEKLHPALPIVAAQVVWATREEMARTVEDVLARRTRALPLNASAAIAMAPRVAEIMARELGKDLTWQRAQVAQFEELARGYIAAAAV